MRRRWWQHAKCKNDNPSAYEFEGVDNMTRVAEKQEVASRLCSGCPVIVECAQDAMDPLAVGTVRGGVWIPGNLSTRSNSSRVRSVLVQLDSVSNG